MAAKSISIPYPLFSDKDGNPLEAGFVYIGKQNLNPLTNPISIFWDEALTIPAANPLRTIGGYLSRNGSPGDIYVNNSYSIVVEDKDNAFVYSKLLNVVDTLELPWYNVLDYGDGSKTDETFNAFIAEIGSTTARVLISRGTYTINSAVSFPENVTVYVEAGVDLLISAGQFSIAGPVQFPTEKIFTISGTGSVVLPSSKIEFVSPIWFGAVGDGSTDDTAAIEFATDSLTEGGMLFFPKGTYVIDTALSVGNSGIKFQGTGAKSILKSGATAGGSAVHMLTLAAKTDIIFQDIRFEGYETNDNIGSIGILAQAGSDRLTVKNCTFSGPNGTTGFNIAVDVIDSDYCSVENNYFERLIGVSSGNGYGVLMNSDCLYNSVVNNKFEMAISGVPGGRHAIYVTSGSSYCSIRGNIINNCNDTNISTFSTAAQNTMVGIVMADNIMRNGNGVGIDSILNTHGFVITGNRISEMADSIANSSGIHLEGDPSGQPSNMLISKNFIESMDGDGIFLHGVNDCVVQGNTIKGFSLGSATTQSGILINNVAGFGGARNIILSNYVIQETIQARSGIEIQAGPTGTIVRNNTVTGSYAVTAIEDDPTDTILTNNVGAIVTTAVSGTVNINPIGVTKLTMGAAVTATLGSGENIGDMVTVVASAGSTASTLSVTNHSTSDPEVFNFTATDDVVVLMWTGTEWITIALVGATV